MVTISVRALGAATAFLLASAPSAHADPPWSTPAVVAGSQADDGLVGPSLAFGSRSAGALFTSRGRPAGELLAPVRRGRVGAAGRLAVPTAGLSGTPAVLALAPAGGSGLFAAVQDRRRRLFAAFGTLGRGLERAQALGPAPRGGVELVANARGDVAITLIDAEGLKLAVRRPGRRFGRPVLVAPVRRAALAPALAVNARGDVLVAWNSEARAGSDAVFARRRTARGRLGAVTRLGPVVGRAAIAAALGPRGGALVAWQGAGVRQVASVAYAPLGTARFRRRQVLESWEGDPGDESETASGIDVGFASEALVVWTGDGPTVRASKLEGGRFAARETLGAAGSLADFAAGPRGEALALWTDGAAAPTLRAAIRPREAAAFAPGAETVSGPGAAAAVGAVAPVGRVPVAAWIDATGDVPAIRWATRTPID